MKVTVRKLGGYKNIDDSFTIDTSELGEKWCSFFLKTDFCRIRMWDVVWNDTVRVGYNGITYLVTSNNRGLGYNTNYEMDHMRYRYVVDFVEYVLAKYKYKTLLEF